MTSCSVVGGYQNCGEACRRNMQGGNQESFCNNVLRIALRTVNGTADCELGRDSRWGRAVNGTADRELGRDSRWGRVWHTVVI